LDDHLTKFGIICTVLVQTPDRREEKMKALDAITALLLVVGGLNWGLVALAEFDLVATVFGEDFGETNAASRVVYGLVGLSAVYQALRLPALLGRRTSNRSHPATA
jgi:uncharacterized protein